MPNRILHERICTSETLAELTPAEEVFYYRLLVQCDDYGRFDARPMVLRARCFPLQLDRVSDADVEGWLRTLARVGLIGLYVVDGHAYLHVCTWDRYQQTRAKHSKYPSPPASDSNGNHLLADASNGTHMSPYPEAYPEANTRNENEGARPAADAAPPKPVPKKASGPDLAPLVDAFRALGLPDPVFAGGEGRAAQDLVRHYTPEVIAACWQDHASGDYGGALDKQKLSFRWLLTGSPVGNWQRWKSAPHAQNGHTKPGRGPGSRQENSTVDYAFQGILAAEPIGPADVTPEQWTAIRTRLGALHEGDVRPEQWRAVQAALGRER